jgi:hypothetical protein
LTKLKEKNYLKYYTAKNSQFIIKVYNRNLRWKRNKGQLSEEHTINHGVREGCPLSHAVFNIYMKLIIGKWKQI